MSYKVYLSPSDQIRNKYAAGNTNEKEQCTAIADAAQRALERCGIDVLRGDRFSIEGRVSHSNAWGADLHVPIHTNAFNDTVSGTRLFYYNAGGEGWKACNAIMNRLAPITPGDSDNVTPYPDLYEIRFTTAPAAYCECEFHDVPDVATWIIKHTEDIGEMIAAGICDYFGVEYKTEGVLYCVQVGAFTERANAEKRLKAVKLDYPDAFIWTKEVN